MEERRFCCCWPGWLMCRHMTIMRFPMSKAPRTTRSLLQRLWAPCALKLARVKHKHNRRLDYFLGEAASAHVFPIGWCWRVLL